MSRQKVVADLDSTLIALLLSAIVMLYLVADWQEAALEVMERNQEARIARVERLTKEASETIDAALKVRQASLDMDRRCGVEATDALVLIGSQEGRCFGSMITDHTRKKLALLTASHCVAGSRGVWPGEMQVVPYEVLRDIPQLRSGDTYTVSPRDALFDDHTHDIAAFRVPARFAARYRRTARELAPDSPFLWDPACFPHPSQDIRVPFVWVYTVRTPSTWTYDEYAGGSFGGTSGGPIIDAGGRVAGVVHGATLTRTSVVSSKIVHDRLGW
jgi:hypothetical protein